MQYVKHSLIPHPGKTLAQVQKQRHNMLKMIRCIRRKERIKD